MISILDNNCATNLKNSPRWARRVANLVSALGRLAVLFSIAAIATPVIAQSPGPNDGILPFSTHEWGIDLASSAIYLSFSGRSKAGKVPYSSSVEETNYYSVVVINGTHFWDLWGQPRFSDTIAQASFSGTYTSARCTNQLYSYTTYTVSVNGFTDGSGAHHPLHSQLQWIRTTNSQGCINQAQKNPVSVTVTDNTGYTLYAGVTGSPVVYDKSGDAFTIPVPSFPCCTSNGKFSTIASTATDPDGVSISGNENSGGAINDTLNTTVLNLSTFINSGYVEPTGASYTDASGGNQAYTFGYTSLPLKTTFNCSGITEVNETLNLLTTIQSPSGQSYTVSYEPTPGSSGYYTGRVSKITLPTGGSISYAYSDSSGHNGIDCSNQTFVDVPTITVTVDDNNGTVSNYTYVHSAASSSPMTVTKTDPAGNRTVYTFYGEFQTQAQYYQGNATGTPLKTVVTCYNGNFTSCANPPSVTLPVTQTDVYTSLNGSQYNVTEAKYDTYGNITYRATYDYNQSLGSAPAGAPLQATVTSYATIGTYIRDKPACSEQTTGSAPSSCGTVTSNTVSLTNYANYTTTGHPQTISNWVSGSSFLSKTYTYNSNGTMNTMHDVNGTLYSYAYNGNGGCNSALLTSVAITGTGLPTNGLTSSTQWNCNGGVVIQSIDPNSQATIYSYNDPLWRRTSVQDPTGATITTCYGLLSSGACTLNSTNVETVLSISANAGVDTVGTVDGLGRTIFTQKRQTPTSSTFDSAQYMYGWVTGVGAFAKLSRPYPGTLAQPAPSGTAVTTTQYEGLGRVQSVTDGGGGMISSVYSRNDVLQKLSPAPAGENLKQRQVQYDGLGRLTSVCEITAASGSGTCAQTNSAQGFYTTYSYTPNEFTVQQNAQGSPTQSRSYLYDGLGRKMSESNPESGTTTYVYGGPGGFTDNCYPGNVADDGNLHQITDANGNYRCYIYDGMRRVTDVGNNLQTTNPCNRFRYDSVSNGLNSSPSGYPSSPNAAGRLVEAATNCAGSSGTITDEWFAYNARGDQTDAFESTPHSGGYYHATANYYANGVPQSLGGIGAQGTYTYGLDGEGRLATTTQGSTNFVTATTYNAASQPLNVSLELGDSDSYAYDSNTGRMTKFTFTVGSTPKSLIGNLTWNPNGTLAQLAITDGFNSSGTQTWNYGTSSTPGYDDLGRLISAVAGSSWSQSFSYDPFGNITKSGSSGWMPGYNQAVNQYLAPANCQTNGGSPCYDNAGQLLNDTFHQYVWSVYAHPVTIAPATGALTCGSTGVTCLTYDAEGRVVEKNVAGVLSEMEYGPTGKIAVMNGSAEVQAYVPLPGGETLSPGPDTFWHRDWLGSIRLASSAANRTVSFDRSFAPFGEVIPISGSSTNTDFTGLTEDTVSDESDTPNRELHPSQSRWVSPDPAGLGAANPSNPQSWNRYAYVRNNPLSAVDPTGLDSSSNQAGNNIARMNYCAGAYPAQGHPNSGFLPCLHDKGAGFGQDNYLDAIMGNTMSDAIEGRPGTFLYLDYRGNLGFGFSEELWSTAHNIIDKDKTRLIADSAGVSSPGNAALATNVALQPYIGWGVFVHDVGTEVILSGIIPDLAKLKDDDERAMALYTGLSQEFTKAAILAGVPQEDIHDMVLGQVYQALQSSGWSAILEGDLNRAMNDLAPLVIHDEGSIVIPGTL